MRSSLLFLVFVCLLGFSDLSAQIPPFDYEVEVLDLDTRQISLGTPRATFASENGFYFEIPGEDDQNPLLYYFDGQTTQLVYNPQENLGSFITESIRFYTAFNDGVLFYVAREQSETTYRYFFHRHGEAAAWELDLSGNKTFADHVIIGDRLIGKIRGGSGIFSTDGTVAGTHTLIESNLVSVPSFEPYEGGVLAYNDNGFYFTDGTVAGTNRLGDMESPPGGTPVIADNTFYFNSNGILYGFDLTTNFNTQLTTNSSYIRALTASEGRLMFVLENFSFGREVWTSDGTVDGTLPYDRAFGTASGVLGDPISAFNKLFFKGSGTEVYTSDGTPDGTVPAFVVSEEISNAESWSLSLLVAETETSPAYFKAESRNPYKSELFVVNSASSAILSVGLIDGAPDYITGYQFTDNGFYFLTLSDLYFTSWATNNTVLIGAVENFIEFLGNVGEKAIFSRNAANFGQQDVEPYAASPESGSIELLGNLNPGTSRSSYPSPLFTLNGDLYFHAFNNETYNVLYTTDGTSSGTEEAIDLYLGTRGSNNITDPIVAGGRLYFNRRGKFWSSNGTVASSVDLGVQSGSWRQVGLVGDTLCFSSPSINGTTSLFLKTNGTPTGSEVIDLFGNAPFGLSGSNIVVSNGRMYFWEFNRRVADVVTTLLVSNNLAFTDRQELLTVTLPEETAYTRGVLEAVDGGIYLLRGGLSGSPDEVLFLNTATSLVSPVISDAGNEESTIYFSGAASSERLVFIERKPGATSQTSRLILIDKNQNTFPLMELRTDQSEEVLELFDFPGFAILATSQRIIRIEEDGSFETLHENEKLRSFTRYKNNRLLFSRTQSATSRNTWITDGTNTNTKLFFGIGGGFDSFIDYQGDPDYAFVGPYMSIMEESLNQPAVMLYNTISDDFRLEPQPNPELANPGSVVAYQGKFYFVATDPLLGREIHVINFNYAKGVDITAYHDENENGLRDEGEPGLQNIGFTATSATLERRAFTNENGQVELELEADSTFTISAGAATCWELISPPASDEVTFRTGEQLELTYGYRLTGDDPGLNLILSSARPRCGFTVPFWLTVQNTGCLPLTGQASLTLPDDVQFVSAPDAPVVDGQIVSWPYADLQPGSTRQYQLFLTMPNEESNGMVIPIDARAFALNAQNDTITQGLFDYRQVLSCAIDPNDKQVLPARVEPSNSNYTQVDETMTFTIRFQNTGTDTAFTVLITDELPRQLDPATFKPLTASHPYTHSINGNDVEFLFENIMLPDSNVNEPLSHGFVTFEILADPEEAIGSNVRNRANIYFDYNSAIRTNRTKSAIVEFLDEDQDGFFFYDECDDKNPAAFPGAFDIAGNGIDEDCDGEDSPVSTRNPLSGTLKVSPNPTAGILNLSFSDQRPLEARLYSLLGKEIQRISFRINSSLDLTTLPTGVYLLRVADAATGEASTRRIIRN